MCDYSLTSVRSRPAKVGDRLLTHNFGTGTRGFLASDEAGVAVCVLPGTELAFADEVKCDATGLLPWRDRVIHHKTAIFRQVNRERLAAHHDALEFPDGRVMLLTLLQEGQQATVLQLPARPKSLEEAVLQRRVPHMG
jgi:predicted ATPase